MYWMFVLTAPAIRVPPASGVAGPAEAMKPAQRDDVEERDRALDQRRDVDLRVGVGSASLLPSSVGSDSKIMICVGKSAGRTREELLGHVEDLLAASSC